MHMRPRRSWFVLVQGLGVLMIVAALVSLAGLSSASAAAPSGATDVSGLSGSSGGMGSGSGDNHMGDHFMGGSRRFHFIQPIYFPIAFPVPIPQPIITGMYGWAQVYVPPGNYPPGNYYSPTTYTSPSYVSPSTYTSPSTVSVQTLAAYGPGWNTGLSQAAIQAVCHQYFVALQYATMTDNPALDQICGTPPTATGTTGSTSTTPSSTPGGSYTPYP